MTKKRPAHNSKVLVTNVSPSSISSAGDILEAIQPDQERFRALLTAISEVVFRVSPDGEEVRFLYARDFPAEAEPPDRNWVQKYIYPEDQVPLLAAIKESIKNKSVFRFEHRALNRDGSVGWVLTRVVPTLGPDGQILEWLGSSVDITERRWAQEALRCSEERFRALVTAASDIVCRWSPHGKELLFIQGGDFLAAGKKPERNWLEKYIPHEDQAHIRAVMEEAIRTKRTLELEHRLVRRDGSLGWFFTRAVPLVDGKGEIIEWFGAARDITERKRAQNELHASEERFRAFVQKSPDGIVIIDHHGCIVEWNQGQEAITGLRRAEVIGRSLLEIHHRLVPPQIQTQDFLPLARERILKALQAHAPLPHPHEFQIQRPDGTRRMLQSVLFTIHSGEDLLVCAICRDTTERREMIEALTEAKEQLRAHAENLEKTIQERTAKLRNALADLEHFSYTIAHNMRAPLRAMQGFSEMLVSECARSLDPRAGDLAQRIKNGARSMDRLIADALDYGKTLREELQLLPVNAHALLQFIVQSYPQFHPPSAEIMIDAIPFVLANEAALTQCFSNLLDNAVKFVPPERTPKVRVWAEPRGQFVRLWFEDNGIGIANEHQNLIWDMFQKLDTNYPGTGVGLALVHKVVERMQGLVGLESEPGQGSRFWVELKSSP